MDCPDAPPVNNNVIKDYNVFDSPKLSLKNPLCFCDSLRFILVPARRGATSREESYFRFVVGDASEINEACCHRMVRNDDKVAKRTVLPELTNYGSSKLLVAKQFRDI